MVGRLPTSSALIENNPPRSAPASSPARRDYTPCGTSFPFNHGLTVAISSVHTPFPHRLSHQRRHHHQRKNLGFTLERMTGGRAPPRETIHHSISPYHPPSSPSTPYFIVSLCTTVSHTSLRCDCSRSVNPYQPRGLLSDAPDNSRWSGTSAADTYSPST